VLEQVITCQILIMASAVLACKGKERFEALWEFFERNLSG
jgi:hypothetical protein